VGIVSDTFTRPDNANLGADWTEEIGDWSIVSNQAECNDDDGGTGYYARFDGTGADVGSVDMYAELVTNSTQTSGGSNTGPSVRRRTGAVTGYQFTTNLNDSCGFWRVVAGAESQIPVPNGSSTFTTPIVVGDTVRLEVTASTLRARVNGALVAIARDTNIADGQRGGLNGYNNVGTDVVRVDNFEAGALSDDPPAAPYIHTWVVFGAGTITPRTPALPATAGQIANGDLILAWATVRDAAQTVTPDATEGWSTIQTPSQTGLESPLFAKVWGLGGQVDDLTPEFSVADATGGFGITLAVIRNPQHATAPWTSVASAIVASGQQSNAANATVTAPAVAATGAHRTVVRFVSSADDNNLGAPSEGLMVFGGTAWHTTQGLDFAQGCSILEDTTLGGSTNTATFTEAAVAPDISNGVTIVVAIPSSGSAVTGTGLVAGGGAVTGAGTRGVSGTGAVIGGGAVTAAGAVGRTGAGLVAGGGAVTGAGVAGRVGVGLVAGGGVVSASGVRGVAGVSTVNGGGSIAAQGTTGRTGAAVVAGGGTITAVGAAGKVGAGLVAGGGVITAVGVAAGAATGVGVVNGGGLITAAGARGVTGTALVAGGGTVAAAGLRGVAGVGTVNGGGAIAAVGVGVSSDVPSQGTYNPWSGTPLYNGTGDRVYDGAGQHVYDP
jgi:hypothetical protein